MALGDAFRVIKSNSVSKPKTYADISREKKRKGTTSYTGSYVPGMNFMNTPTTVACRGTFSKPGDDYVPVLTKALKTKKELEEIERIELEKRGGNKMERSLAGILNMKRGRSSVEKYGIGVEGKSTKKEGGLKALLVDIKANKASRSGSSDRRYSTDRSDVVIDNGMFALTADGKYIEKQDEITNSSMNVLSLIPDIPEQIANSGIEVNWGYMVLLELGNNKDFQEIATDEIKRGLKELAKAVSDRDTDRIKEIFTMLAEILGPYRSVIPNSAVVTFAVIGKYTKDLGAPNTRGDVQELPSEVVAAIGNFRIYVHETCLNKANNTNISSRLPDYLIEDLRDLLDVFSTGNVDDILRAIEETKKSANMYSQQNKNMFNNAGMLSQNLKLLQDTITQYTKSKRGKDRFGINKAGSSEKFGISNRYGIISDRFTGKSVNRDEGLGLSNTYKRDDDDDRYNGEASLSILRRKNGSIIDTDSDFERSRKDAERMNPYVTGKTGIADGGLYKTLGNKDRERDPRDESDRDPYAMARSLKESCGMI